MTGRLRRRAGAFALALGLAAAPMAQAAPQITAVLQGLDKITARISTIEAPLDQEVSFGDLRIVVRACQKRPPEEPPESAAFLEIREAKQGGKPTLLFSGWMFASSPAVSALDHPVYDVWVLDCKTTGEAPAADKPDDAKPADAKPAAK
ncbi:MAG: DUF2155 domain-containing protein [Candidatus Eiseniibacteriota bacterium]